MNKHEGSTLESLFEELGELEEVEARAAKKILAIQTERRMAELGLSTTVLASRMRTSRNQVHRILDENDAGITLRMLFRLSQALRMPLSIEFRSSSAKIGKKSAPRAKSQAAAGQSKSRTRRTTSSARRRAKRSEVRA